MLASTWCPTIWENGQPNIGIEKTRDSEHICPALCPTIEDNSNTHPAKNGLQQEILQCKINRKKTGPKVIIFGES